MQRIVSVANMGSPDQLVQLAVEIEEAAFDGFFFMDHMNTAFLGQDEALDPWVLLSAVASATRRLRLGTAVTPISKRHPWKLAKEIIALDHVSHGRVTVGVGLGDADEHEFAPFGEVTDQRARAGQTDEALTLLDQLLRGEPVDHAGDHYNLRTHLKPAAVQSPRPPSGSPQRPRSAEVSSGLPAGTGSSATCAPSTTSRCCDPTSCATGQVTFSTDPGSGSPRSPIPTTNPRSTRTSA